MLLLMLMSALAQAEEPDRIHGFRIGVCGGFSAECIGINPKLEYAGKYAGININTTLVTSAISLRLYPIPVRERPHISWRPYGYFGASVIVMALGLAGGGVGADIHLTPSRRLCLQPSVGAMSDQYGDWYYSGAFGAMYTF